MLKNLMTGVAALALSVTALSGAANALVIDDFSTALSGAIVSAESPDDGNTLFSAGSGITVSGGGSAFDRSSGAGILGGDRELKLVHTNGLGSVNALVAGGYFSHSNAAGATGTSLLRWDGTSGDTDDLDFNLGGAGAGVDLTAGGGTYFHLTVISADLNGSSMEVRLYTSASKYSIAAVDIPIVSTTSDSNPINNSPYEFFLSLTDIQAGLGGLTMGGGVTLTDVRAIEWFADGSELNFDATIDIVDIVPEPASLTLLGAGIMGLGYFGRRRKA